MVIGGGPGLKTGVEMAFFGLKLGVDLELRGGTPPPKIPKSTPPGAKARNVSFSTRYFGQFTFST